MMMKMNVKLSVIAVAVLASGSLSNAALAESTYGYNAAGAAAAVKANARLDITVKVPKLILLRVGSSGATVDEVVLQGVFAGGIPGGVASLADGSNQPTGWDGTAPAAMTLTSTPANVTAYAWTNANGGGSLDGAVTTAFAGTITGLTAANIEVTSTTVGLNGLAHPGTDTGTFTPTTFLRNTLVSSTWAFSIPTAILPTLGSGTDTQRVTYTATTL